jgi:hypothetical protein
MMVPERSLNISWLKIMTGRKQACSWLRTGFKSAQRISPLSIPAIGSHPPLTLLLPYTRAGIALAGANHALDSGDLSASNGIMTAEKILGMKLRGTNMVVLSACEIGLEGAKVCSACSRQALHNSRSSGSGMEIPIPSIE